jgi:hypothetical protein
MIKRNKITAVFLSVLLLTAAFSVSVSAASARLVDIDRDTRGDWLENYGSEGYLIAADDDSLQNLPAYATVEFFDEFLDERALFWRWWDSEYDDEMDEDWRVPSALIKAPGSTERVGSCFYGGEFNMIIDLGDESRKVSLYITDFDEGNRESEISVLGPDGSALIPVIEAFGYEEGWYLQFILSGRVQFRFESLGGPNAVISGVFFDPDPDAPAEEEAPLETEEESGIGGGDYAEVDEIIAAIVPDTAPPTADPVTLIIAGSLISAAVIAVTRKRK